jgi:hypothetical protein
MDFFNIDPNLIRLSPVETRILALAADPYPDGRRIRIHVEITPFLQPPTIELTLTDCQGNEAGSTSIVEPPGWLHELTMHIKEPLPTPTEYHLTARLIYPDLEHQDQQGITIPISEGFAES